MDKINGISVFDTSNKYKELYEIECNLDLQSRELRIKYLEQWIIEKNKLPGFTQYDDRRYPNIATECLRAYEELCKSYSFEYPVSAIIDDVEAAMKNVYGLNQEKLKE